MSTAFTTAAAQTAASFNESIGINIHPAYPDTQWANVDAWMPSLLDGGFAHVRTNWWLGDSNNDALIEKLAGTGIKVMVTSDWFYRTGTSPQAAVEYLAAHPKLAASISEIEGPNEVNANFSDWQTGIAPFMRELYTAIKANPATAHIQVVAPCFDEMRNTEFPSKVGDISKWVDLGDIHGSNGVEAPTDAYYDTVIGNAQVLSGKSHPLINSEGGYSYGTDSSALGHPIPLPPDAVEIDVMHYYLENFAHGIVHSDLYQLINTYPNGPWGDKFGLLTDDYAPTPTYKAIHALTTLLKDPGDPPHSEETFTPGHLTYALDGGDANTRTLLLQKSDGSYWLAVWEQEQVFKYNVADSEKGPVDHPALPMTLKLEGPASGAVYMPDSGSTDAVATFSGTDTIKFDGGPKVALIRISEAAETSSPTPAPAPTPTPSDGAEAGAAPVLKPVFSDGYGHDLFVVNSMAEAGSTIADFHPQGSFLLVSQVLAEVGYRGNDPIGDHVLSLVQSGSDTRVMIDPHGVDPAHGQVLVTVEHATPSQVHTEYWY